MWTNLRKEIELIRKDFGLTNSQFQPLNLNEWAEIEGKIYQIFCNVTYYNSKPTWLWEYFKLDTFSLPNYTNPYLILDKLIDNQETVWFIVNETINESTKFWFYQGQIKPIQTIIAESKFIDELYLVSKKYEWILCINHHDILITSGKIMSERLTNGLIL